MVKEWKMVWRVLNKNLVYGFSLHEFSVAQWIERPPGVWEVISSNRVHDSVFFFAPLSCHAVYLIITFVSPSLKFAIFHSFTNIEISIYRKFSNDVTAAIFVLQKYPVGIELFSHVKTFFYSKQFATLLTKWAKTIYKLSWFENLMQKHLPLFGCPRKISIPHSFCKWPLYTRQTTKLKKTCAILKNMKTYMWLSVKLNSELSL